MTPSPKLLPWLARKAGLSLEKAEALWRENFATDSMHVQSATNPDQFLRRVLDQFQQYAAREQTQFASSRAMTSQAVACKTNRGDAFRRLMLD